MLPAATLERPPAPARVPSSRQPGKTISWNLQNTNSRFTFERKPLNVGFIISVVVTLTLEEKAMSISVFPFGNLFRNLVCVCVVLQGRGQSDT